MQNKLGSTTATALLLALLSSSALAVSSAPGLSLEDVKPLKRDQWLSYRQSNYQLVDPAGDLILLRITANLPQGLLEVLSGKKELPLDQTLEVYELPQVCFDQGRPDTTCDEGPGSTAPAGPSIEGRLNPLKPAQLAKMYMQVIQEEARAGLPPKTGEFHDWSSEIRQKYGKNSNDGESYPLTLRIPKVLAALFSGLTSQYMRTDREGDLARWILAQPFRSVTLESIFRQSYRINQGDVYLSILTIENLLSRRWRLNDRENLPITRRLKTFASYSNGDSEDDFGMWYHFHGTMLYAYMYGESAAAFAAQVEHIGSFLLDLQTETQEHWSNLMGAQAGSAIRKIVDSGAYLKHSSDPKLLDESSYLDRSEDFRDRLPIKVSRNFAVFLSRDAGGKSVYVRNMGPALKGCKVEVMLNIGEGLDSRRTVIRKNVSFAKEKSIVFYASDLLSAAKGQQPTQARVFVSECVSSPQAMDTAVVDQDLKLRKER